MQSKDTDDDEPPEGEPAGGSHGTMMACKAAGKRYGIAKQAAIIPVKILFEEMDLLNGLEMAFRDIRDKDRALKSVVVVSQAIPGATTREKALQTELGIRYLTAINRLIALGTPVVMAAGNARDEEDGTREDIDLLPQVLEHPDVTPIINVGAATIEGYRVAESQGGPQLSIYAPGQTVISLTKDSKSTTFRGTSIGEQSQHYE
jgi:subtilisin family serine protease